MEINSLVLAVRFKVPRPSLLRGIPNKPKIEATSSSA